MDAAACCIQPWYGKVVARGPVMGHENVEEQCPMPAACLISFGSNISIQWKAVVVYMPQAVVYEVHSGYEQELITGCKHVHIQRTGKPIYSETILEHEF